MASTTMQTQTATANENKQKIESERKQQIEALWAWQDAQQREQLRPYLTSEQMAELVENQLQRRQEQREEEERLKQKLDWWEKVLEILEEGKDVMNIDE
ncbi:hypothetical protein RRF57_003047 [Xylaria bambusicola]|uniref:Uncharacterized protein n=1 Tax=Xylaria bambusicola TaxID=326684 RepID=A0AAN7Z2D5_9PEZI